jgi:hypothetical protein
MHFPVERRLVHSLQLGVEFGCRPGWFEADCFDFGSDDSDGDGRPAAFFFLIFADWRRKVVLGSADLAGLDHSFNFVLAD